MNIQTTSQILKLKKLGIDTYKEAVIYIHQNCHICRSEGFEAQARIKVTYKNNSIIATLNTIDSQLLALDEASLSNYAWELLGLKEGDDIYLSHPEPLRSLRYIRSKIYGNELQKKEMTAIVADIAAGYHSDVHISAFVTACAGGRLNKMEIRDLTRAMINVGERLTWPSAVVVDKHCVGGLPGNRTSLIVVPIVTAYGLTMPKTSSRAITSPAGTADTMEVLAPVNLNLNAMRKVVEQENGCIVWGGTVTLSPADDILIRIEHTLDLDTEGQLVASILSKKIAAGSSHIIIDLPVGPTAKARNWQIAGLLKDALESIGKNFDVKIRAIFTDGLQPVGRGIGPSLEAKDVLAVLQNDKHAPQDLRERSLMLAGQVLEFSKDVLPGTGAKLAQTILDSGQAWKKFQAICRAQGGLFEPTVAAYTKEITANVAGRVMQIDNRRLARLAKLAGAPNSKAAGVELLTPLNTIISKGQPLFVIHAETPGELKYALSFLEQEHNIIKIQ